jgi:hypothetical protein
MFNTAKGIQIRLGEAYFLYKSPRKTKFEWNIMRGLILSDSLTWDKDIPDR